MLHKHIVYYLNIFSEVKFIQQSKDITMQLNHYLNFKGQTEAAFLFYQSVLKIRMYLSVQRQLIQMV